MKCPNCGKEIEDKDSNFCIYCGTKLKENCNCWIKNGSYNCGESNCPGYGLFRLEKRVADLEKQIKSQLIRKENYSDEIVKKITESLENI